MGSVVLQAGTKATGRMVLSQDAVTACILLNGRDLPCTVPIKCLTSHPYSDQRDLFADWVTGVTLL